MAWQFNNEAIRLTLAALDGGLQSTESYIASTYQKFMKRELKIYSNIGRGRALKASKGGTRPYTTESSSKNPSGTRASRSRKSTASKSASKTATTDMGDSEEENEENTSEEDELEDDEGSEEEQDDVEGVENETGLRRLGIGKNPRPDMATKPSPVVLTHYGQISLCAKSYQGAICECHSSV